MRKVQASSAMSAALLTTVLDAEGHRAVWYVVDGEHIWVATTASVSDVMAAVSTVETMLRVPAHRRTRVVAAEGVN